MEKKITSLDETKEFGELIGKYAQTGMCILLTGDLGAGKTTLTKSIGKGLGIEDTINSPTFTILKSYEGRMPLYHIDAYRLEGLNQDLGFEEVIEGDGLCIIEWPMYIEDVLPQNYLSIDIKRDGEFERSLMIESKGEMYNEMMEAIK